MTEKMDKAQSARMIGLCRHLSEVQAVRAFDTLMDVIAGGMKLQRGEIELDMDSRIAAAVDPLQARVRELEEQLAEARAWLPDPARKVA
jgi:hypothetical protein